MATRTTTTYSCDRCKGPINDASERGSVEFSYSFRAYDGAVGGASTGPLDLCLGCSMELREWLATSAKEG